MSGACCAHAWIPGIVARLQASLDGHIAGGDVTGPVAQQLVTSLTQARRAIDQGTR